MEAAQQQQGLDLISEWVSGISSHVGICVPDLDEAKRFYCGLLGFQEAWTIVAEGEFLEKFTGIPGLKETCVQLLVPGGGRIELQEYEPVEGLGTASINRVGLNHLSFGVKSVRAEYERLSAAGVKFNGPPSLIEFPGHPLDRMDCVYFEDPWGLTLEMMGPSASGGEEDERPPRGSQAA